MTGVIDPEDPVFVELRREYLADATERLAELRKDLDAFRVGEPDALNSLRQRFHRLAGSGGSYGFPKVSETAREMERRILTAPIPTPQESDQFEHALHNLRAAFDEAAQKIPAAPDASTRSPGFGHRALVLMPATPVCDAIAAGLRKADFEVDVRHANIDPQDLGVSEHPDLVVIGTDLDDAALAIAGHWAAMTINRPRAVVLADPDGQLDRLRSAAAGIDAVFGPDALPVDLTQYARGLARIGAPPANVVVVEDDPAQAQLISAWLAHLNARVSLCSTAQSATETLIHEQPDMVLLDVDLPDVDGYAIARFMRQEPRLALVPIVFLTARRSIADEMEGLRAGGDDFLGKPVDRNHLQQVVLTRTERGRRIREMAHRDGLTGLLNHATLMAELEHAIAYSMRHGEALCFLMLDLDHFKRINDTYGHLIGDQVLTHVAAVFRTVIRTSDVIGRYGGEEFGIILRRCPPDEGRKIGEKLRERLSKSPIRIRAGEMVSPKVSIGIATFVGQESMTVTDITDAADRALYIAKRSGRDRVELG